MTRRTKPPWLKVRAPGGQRYTQIKSRARSLNLHTVCEEAQCPNIGECWGGGTATFMVMGSICTRGCRFCAVNTRRNGAPLEPLEPANVAEAIAEMGLDYVVVTSVNRDDLPTQGAEHFAQCIATIRERNPNTLVEVLIPDFRGRKDLLALVVNARPDVLAHNIECVRRMTPTVRDPRAAYDQSLSVLAEIKRQRPSMPTKSSIMLGVGESETEVMETMGDLRSVGVDFLTLGQYLQPTQKHLSVQNFVHPDVFDRLRVCGEGLGFHYVASGPLVRSSYRAGEFFLRQFIAPDIEPNCETA
ncbi:MAG TPA: lipoyl synthase [Myxococcales bacterium]|nr:lipoyl synthase [Myxococcales bacterium]